MSDDGRYRLAPVREARARDERTTQGALATAVGDTRAVAARLALAARQVEVARAALSAAEGAARALVTAGTTPATLTIAAHHTARRRRDLDAALDAHARAAAAHAGQVATVDAARDRLARARAARELLERHFTRWRAARAQLAERRDD